MKDIKDYYYEYEKIKKSNGIVPAFFHSNIVESLGLQITNDAVRKRFTRILKLSGTQREKAINNLSNLERVRIKNISSNDSTYEEEVTEKGIRLSEAEKMTPYLQFLEENGIRKEDVADVYFKEKSDGIKFTVRMRGSQVDESLFEETAFSEFLKTQSFQLPKKIQQTKTNNVAILNLYDAHCDKLSYLGNGGREELFQNLDVLKSVFSEMLGDVLKHNPQNIIFPIGSDWFNTNGAENMTKNGTPQQITVRWQDSFEAGVDFYRSCIDEIIKHTNVHLLDIAGNHDRDKVYYLGQVIKAIYEKDERVNIILNRHNRKYLYINDILFGFQHGDIGKNKISKLPNVMAVEQPQNWATAKYKLWIMGDRHHKVEYNSFSSVEEGGVEIKFFRPSTTEDQWHFEQMWIGARKSMRGIVYEDGARKIHDCEIIF